MVKDKRITLVRNHFMATVEHFQDTPARDRDAAIVKSFDSLTEAHGFLGGFPDDVWDGVSGAQKAGAP